MFDTQKVEVSLESLKLQIEAKSSIKTSDRVVSSPLFYSVVNKKSE